MSRNEIKLRRQRAAATGASKFRNYGHVLQRHEREMKMKKIFRVLSIVSVILILILLVIAMQIIVMTRKNNPSGGTKTELIQDSRFKIQTHRESFQFLVYSLPSGASQTKNKKL